jgi:YesN/AraC family two-component response regulator
MIFDLNKKNDRIKFLIYQEMEIRQGYLNKDFTLALLSETIQCNKYQTLTMFKEKYGVSFYLLVNKLRINHIKWLIAIYGYKLTETDYVNFSGFVSKQTMLKNFKKFSGVSFHEYQNQVFNKKLSQKIPLK